MTGKPKRSSPAKPGAECLEIGREYYSDAEREQFNEGTREQRAAVREEVIARALVQPEVQAAATIQKLDGQMNVNALARALRAQVAQTHGGNLGRAEAMLVSQAHTLDALFGSLARRAYANCEGGFMDAADRYFRLALKAQSQSVRCVEALAELKNPRPVAFVRQANIAHNQQINNGVAPPTRAQETENAPTQLLGEADELRTDTGTQSLASQAHQPLEAVGAIHGSEDGGRQG